MNIEDSLDKIRQTLRETSDAFAEELKRIEGIRAAYEQEYAAYVGELHCQSLRLDVVAGEGWCGAMVSQSYGAGTDPHLTSYAPGDRR